MNWNAQKVLSALDMVNLRIDPAHRKTHGLVRFLFGSMFVAIITIAGWAHASDRNYEVMDVRHKSVTGTWGFIESSERQYIKCIEGPVDGWVLELLAGPEEEQAWAVLLESDDQLIWEGIVGDATILSQNAPLIVTSSPLATGLDVYNFRISSEPVYSDPAFQVWRVVEAPAAGVFGILGSLDIRREPEIRLISVEGVLLGSIPLPDIVNVVGLAISNEGKHVAVAWSYRPMTPAMVRELPTSARLPRRGKPGLPIDSSDSKGSSVAKPLDSQHIRPQGSARTDVPRFVFGVTVYSSSGEIVGSVSPPTTWSTPTSVVVSADSTPRIGIATVKGASMWTTDNRLVWSDSLAFLENGSRGIIRALHLTEDGSLLAVSAYLDGRRVFRAWDSSGVREAEILIPKDFDSRRTGMQFYREEARSISIQSARQVVTIQW